MLLLFKKHTHKKTVGYNDKLAYIKFNNKKLAHLKKLTILVAVWALQGCC